MKSFPRFSIGFFGVLLGALSTVPALPGQAQSVRRPNSAAATVVMPLQVSVGSPLSSAVQSQDADGTMELGGTFGGGSQSSETFRIKGQPNCTYEISASDTEVTLRNGRNKMTARLEYRSSNGGKFPNFALDFGGFDAIGVGGKLRIPRFQPPGLYSGSFTLTTNYN